ncbi:MAG: fimbrillin family protein, partial [Muribaculaceae bacterium]|nr:fimbrillin family protein [Muribaculaceae bacterium]
TMKSNLFILSIAALAAAGLTSCADDEPLDARTSADNETIAFRPAMGGITRATETTNDNISSIYVTALMGGKKYFSDVEFSKGAEGFFTAADGGKYVWPGDTTRLSFYSYSPSQDALGADIVLNENNVPELQDYVTPENIADQVDFITSNATGNRTDNEESGVELTFSHRFAQVEVRAKSNDTKYVYKVAGARIGRPRTTGSYNFGTDTWTMGIWNESAVFDTSITPVTLSGTAASLMGEAGNGMFIPQSLTPWDPISDPDNVARGNYLSVLVNITTADGTQLYPFPSDKQLDSTGKKRQYAWASIPISGKWEAGKKYVYTLDFTNGAGNVDPDDPTPGNPVLGKDIKFTVNVLDWAEADSAIPVTTTYKK